MFGFCRLLWVKNNVEQVASIERFPAAADEVLSIQGLGKSYGSTKVLHDVHLTVAPGERVALMGRSGSGKSTLLNCICGIEPFHRGEIVVAGKRLRELSTPELERLRREEIGYVFQTFHLLPTLTALENIEFPGQLIGLPTPERRQRANELLALVGMEHRRDHRPSTLSGGERQRIALARSIMNRPRLILADEPTGSLDSTSGDRVLDLMVQISKESDVSVLLVTHDLECTRICDRVVSMEDGQIREAQR